MRAFFWKIPFGVLIFLSGCTYSGKDVKITCGRLNMSHFSHLYSDVSLPNGHKAGVVHIYSEYPDYNYQIEQGEGYTCVDDVSRAVVLLSNCRKAENCVICDDVLDKMVDFLVYMQSDNGYFFNFIWPDGSINKTYRTSLAKPDWWSWRAFWAMEVYAALGDQNKMKIEKASSRIAENIFRDLYIAERGVSDTAGVRIPAWLPGGSASDQAADLVLALCSYYQRTGDARAPGMIRQLADGIAVMQAGDSLNFPYGAFLSWMNMWHAYGNVQSYALLQAGELLHEAKYVDRALLEIGHFYPWLMDQGFYDYFILKKENENYVMTDQAKFPQIAYGIRPMVWACTEAYRITGDNRYLELAKRTAEWFTGNNPAGKAMWDPVTGRGFDGINGTDKINLNSGAESTIEALLALQALETAGIDINDIFLHK